MIYVIVTTKSKYILTRRVETPYGKLLKRGDTYVGKFIICNGILQYFSNVVSSYVIHTYILIYNASLQLSLKIFIEKY